MSFKTEIEAIVGDIDSPDYTAQATLYLVAVSYTHLRAHET